MKTKQRKIYLKLCLLQNKDLENLYLTVNLPLPLIVN